MTLLGICYCGAYGGGRHTKSARCDGSREYEAPPPLASKDVSSIVARMRSMLDREPPNYCCSILLPAEDAAALLDEIERWKEQAFRPLGDNHHNAKLCPHCSRDETTVALRNTRQEEICFTYGCEAAKNGGRDCSPGVCELSEKTEGSPK